MKHHAKQIISSRQFNSTQCQLTMAQQVRFLAALALLMVFGSAGMASAALSCEIVRSHMEPCRPFLRREHAEPSEECCDGARATGRYFNSHRNRRAACECFRSETGSSVQGLDLSRITSLPQRCDVNVRLPHITRRGHFDCSR